MIRNIGRFVAAVAMALVVFQAPSAKADETYSPEELFAAASGFFGDVTEGLAKVIEKSFKDLGQPNGFIAGEEVGGAFFVGLRYGRGTLHRKTAPERKVYWQGPSVGFDFGGNASKVFALVYHLKDDDALFRRYPGVDGSIYVVAGIGVNYQQNGDTIIAPIRTGVGWRFGANIGYLHYGREPSLLPF